ncbi:MAG TPA: ribosome small subunit-dependent GTPase A [Lachnospiraceae bacterium]|nr:ribosome small subunit-dependent GTPase A [Lachnospiraceae bacterium]
MQGKIIKGIAGFYYVHVENRGIYECKAKGIFRKDNLKPLVGDNVEIEVLDEEYKLGNIVMLSPRSNALLRPAVANVDQALIIFSITKPAPSLNLLDRFLIMMQQQDLPCIICFNKQDIADEMEQKALADAYENCGYRVIFVSALKESGMDELLDLLQHKTTTVAGPSGVGKSSLVNRLQNNTVMETGAISVKIERGKNTTRHTELISMGDGTYIMDTPGFSSLSLFDMEKEDLCAYYPEFDPYIQNCRFRGCAHINEPVCGVKVAVREGQISKIRYDNYVLLYEELKNTKKY